MVQIVFKVSNQIGLFVFVAFGYAIASPGNSEQFLKNRMSFSVQNSAKIPFAGGISALFYQPQKDNTLIGIVDRGPNANVLPNEPDKLPNRRPFVNPEFSPHILIFQLPLVSKPNVLKIKKTIDLLGPTGKKISGLPNKHQDENPVDLKGKYIRHDPNGLDPEGLVVANDGSFWISEEYGPSLVHFDASGKWLERFVPQGGLVNGMEKTHDNLPTSYSKRRLNWGFEALAIEGDTLYAFLQGPLADGKKNVRILAFDTKSKQTVGEYLYLLSDPANNKIGDAVSVGESKIWILEHGKILSDGVTQKLIRQVDLSKATNLLAKEIKIENLNIDSSDLAELKKQKIRPATAITLSTQLTTQLNYTMKPEGLAYDSLSKTLYIANDNDFGLIGGINSTTHTPEMGSQKSFIERYEL